MRRKLIVATTAGALALGGALAVTVPATAEEGPSTSREDQIREALAELVEDGSITEAQADEVATTLAGSGLGGHGGPGGPRGGGRFDLAAAATALELTEEELREALQAEGTSLADVAAEQGVDVDALVTVLVEAEQERVAQAVEDGDLTQEEADERLADLEERVTERVHGDAPAHRGGPEGAGGPRGDRHADGQA